MGYRPPKGVRPPQLEGKRTGRPKGSNNFTRAWQDCVWGYQHRQENCDPPNQAARLWRDFARCFPDEMSEWLHGRGALFRQMRTPGLESTVQDMRWVLNHGKEADMTPAHRAMRQWMEKSFKSFFSQLVRWEIVLHKLLQSREKAQHRGVQRWR